jgi:hypothetical protein
VHVPQHQVRHNLALQVAILLLVVKTISEDELLKGEKTEIL